VEDFVAHSTETFDVFCPTFLPQNLLLTASMMCTFVLPPHRLVRQASEHRRKRNPALTPRHLARQQAFIKPCSSTTTSTHPVDSPSHRRRTYPVSFIDDSSLSSKHPMALQRKLPGELVCAVLGVLGC